MNVLLVDDHPLILDALKTVIQGLAGDVQVCGVATAQQARETLECNQSFDMVLLDLDLGHTSGFDLLSEFRANYPALPVVVLSASDRSSDVLRSIDMGAMGYVPKRASSTVLFEALRLVMSGGIYVPLMDMGGVGHSMQRRHTDLTGGNKTTSDSLASVQEHAKNQDFQSHPDLNSFELTPRQKDVLMSLLKGHPNKTIARELHISVETVKDHVAAVLRALNVSSRTQAVLAVSQMYRPRNP
jgi:DNA-binding NarL/FixJ family response regulator